MITLNLVGPQPAATSVTQRLTWGGMVVVAVALCGLHVAQSRRLASLASQVQDLRSEAAQLSSRVANEQKKARANSELAARLGLIERLGRHRGRALQLLSGVGEVLAERMWLTQFSYSTEGLVLAGVAETPEQVAAFLHRLDSVAGFTGVELLDLKQVSGDALAPRSRCRFTVKVAPTAAGGAQA